MASKKDDGIEDRPETESTKATTKPLPTVGKQWGGQKFAPSTTPEQIIEDQKIQDDYADPNAISFDAYCAVMGIRDPVIKAAMHGHTRVRNATKEAWDKIFANF